MPCVRSWQQREASLQARRTLQTSVLLIICRSRVRAPPATPAVSVHSALTPWTGSWTDRYRFYLAASPANLGHRFMALGRTAEPLTQEAVDIYRELAAANPDRYRPNPAASLRFLPLRWKAWAVRRKLKQYHVMPTTMTSLLGPGDHGFIVASIVNRETDRVMAELARAHLVGWMPECIAATRPRSVRYLVRRQAHASPRWTPLRGRDYGVRGTGERKAGAGRMHELLAPPGWSWPPTEQLSRPVDQGLLRGFLFGVLARSFDEFAVDEGRSGADQGDEVGGVDGPPAVLC